MDYVDCAAPPCEVVIEAPAPAAEGPLVEILRPLDEALASVTAATGLGLEPLLSDEERAALGRLVLEPEEARNYRVSALVAGNPTGRRIVFLHGSPGEAGEWGAFLTDVPPDLEYVAVDRPGFGESGPDEAVPSLAEQAAAVRPFLVSRGRAKPIVVGYSMGVPVAVRLALDAPTEVGGLMLIAGGLDPALENVHLLQEIAAVPPLSEILPRDLANANAELLALSDELIALLPRLADLGVPVMLVHGAEDSLVPVDNAAFIRDQLTAVPWFSSVIVEDADHFLPWSHHDLLAEMLARLLAASEALSY